MNDNRARHFEQRGGHEITLAARRWLRIPLIALIGAVACGDSSTVRPAPEDSNEEDAGLEPDDVDDGEDGEVDRDAGRDAGTIRRDAGADAAVARSDAGRSADGGPATGTDAGVAAPTTTTSPGTPTSPGTASPVVPVPPGPTGAGTAPPESTRPDPTSAGTASPGATSPGTPDPQPGGGNPPATGPEVIAPPPPPDMTAPPSFCAQRKLQWRVALTVRDDGCLGGMSNGVSQQADVNLADGAKGFGAAAGLSNCIDSSLEPTNECSIRLDLDCPTDLGIRGRVTGTLTFGSERSFSGMLYARLTNPIAAPCNMTFEATGTR